MTTGARVPPGEEAVGEGVTVGVVGGGGTGAAEDDDDGAGAVGTSGTAGAAGTTGGSGAGGTAGSSASRSITTDVGGWRTVGLLSPGSGSAFLLQGLALGGCS